MARLTLGDNAHGALEAELLNERAESLGRTGRAAQQALERLRPLTGDEREALLDEAASKVWSFFVQRELCGFSTTAQVAQDLDVPPDVMARLGAGARRSA